MLRLAFHRHRYIKHTGRLAFACCLSHDAEQACSDGVKDTSGKVKVKTKVKVKVKVKAKIKVKVRASLKQCLIVDSYKLVKLLAAYPCSRARCFVVTCEIKLFQPLKEF